MNEAIQYANSEHEHLDIAVSEAYGDIARYNPGEYEYTEIQLTLEQEIVYGEALRRLEEDGVQPQVLALRRSRKESTETYEEKQRQQYVYATELFRDILAKNEQHKQLNVRRQEIAKNVKFIEEIKTGVQTKRSVAQQRQQQIIDDLKRFRNAKITQPHGATSIVPPPAPRFAPAPPPQEVTLETLQNNGRMSVEDEARIYKEVFGDSFGYGELSKGQVFTKNIQEKVSNARQYIRDTFGRANRVSTGKYISSSAASTNVVSKVKEYFADDDKGRRRAIVAGVVGSIAAGVAVYVGLKYGLSSLVDDGPRNEGVNTSPTVPSVSISETEMQHIIPDGTDSATAPKSLVRSHGDGAIADRLSKALGASERTFSLGHGDNSTIWGQSKEYLTAHGIQASDKNIDIVKDAVLDRYDISEAGATRLPVGGYYVIPREVIEQLFKDNE
jgi:hypothetical protein